MRSGKLVPLAMSVLILAGCAGGAKNDSAAADVPEVTASAADAQVTEAETPETPSIEEDFSGGEHICKNRGTAFLQNTDDEAASDGKALKIFGRTDSWAGAQYKADEFRGNTIKVKGSFRSEAPSVKISIQYTVNGNTAYIPITSVNTEADKYNEGEGTFEIPTGADYILIYFETDKLEDIYCDSFSVNVEGEYRYFPEPVDVVFADTSDYPSLKELYSDYFLMGVATAPSLLEEEHHAALVKAQFNSMTLGNSFKPDSILDHNKCVRNLEKYKLDPAVKFDSVKKELDFAKENGFTVRGHVLVWHSQTPDWFFYEDYNVSGELASRETMLARMENYIRSVVQWADENYPGLVSAWDVVNEAADDGQGKRKSLWLQTVGDDFIEQAFSFARKYAPEGTKLFYNDYNCFYSHKRREIISFLKPIVEAGNIDGVGMQSHVKVTDSVTNFMSGLKEFYDELGVEIHITELDVGKDNSDDWLQKQGDYYKDFMSYLVELDKTGIPITSVTVWGISDADSWRASEYPILFNADLSRKPAFDGMVAGANGLS